jgi:hypothetical protein
MMDYNNPNNPWMNTGYDPYKGLNDKERKMVGCLQVLLIIIGLLLCCLFSSCTTTKYVQVPVVHTDTTVITKHQRDSIYVHDSTFIKEKGDTMLIERWHTQWRDRIVHDTLYKAKVDSVPYPVEVIKEVPAKLTWWQKARLHIANISLLALLVLVIYYLGKWHIGRLGG